MIERSTRIAWCARMSLLLLWVTSETAVTYSAAKAEDKATAAQNPATTTEARARARLLHETIHGVLQVVHRDFFREDESLGIPSRSLDDVFSELERSHHVKLRWLAVNAKAMNVDHQPQNEFEREAVKVLRAGKTEYESFTPESFRFVGSIHLSAQCLKCHLPLRTNNEARAAGLVITMPLKAK